MSRRVRLAGVLFAFAILFGSGGCGKKETPPVPVSGTVTCDGKPLAEGVIYFKTVQTGVIDTVPVKDGKFEGKAAEGERRVEVNAYRTKTVGSGAMVGEVQENTIARRFNLDSKLTATVTRGGPNEFKFEVSAK